MSSAGVYLPSDQLPHLSDPVDQKAATGVSMKRRLPDRVGIAVYSNSPYLYLWPQNYNELESWFLTELRDRPILIPGNGLHITSWVMLKI